MTVAIEGKLDRSSAILALGEASWVIWLVLSQLHTCVG